MVYSQNLIFYVLKYGVAGTDNRVICVYNNGPDISTTIAYTSDVKILQLQAKQDDRLN